MPSSSAISSTVAAGLVSAAARMREAVEGRMLMDGEHTGRVSGTDAETIPP
jgi:hypothetical protein